MCGLRGYAGDYIDALACGWCVKMTQIQPAPSKVPTKQPTKAPTTKNPSKTPTKSPSQKPTKVPTKPPPVDELKMGIRMLHFLGSNFLNY